MADALAPTPASLCDFGYGYIAGSLQRAQLFLARRTPIIEKYRVPSRYVGVFTAMEGPAVVL